MVRLVDGTNYDLGNPSTSGLPTMMATSTNPLVAISRVGAQNVVESSELRFRLTASPHPNANVPVTVHVSQTGDFIADTETFNSDNVIVKTVSIPSTGDSIGIAEFTVDLDDDDTVDTNTGTITATIQSGSGFVTSIYTQTATATIHDNDTLPVLSIADSGPVSESDGSVQFTITADVPSNTDLTVEYLIENGMGDDFIDVPNPRVEALLEFRDAGGGAGFTDTITVQLDDDDLDEADGAISVTLQPDTTFPFSYAVDATANKGSANVTDNDDLPVLTISDAMNQEGTIIEFIPTLANPSGRDVVVTYSTTAGEGFPADSTDYTIKTDEMITIPKGETTPIKQDGSGAVQPIEITTAVDNTPEPDETFILTFEADFADTSADNTATGTILSEDDPILAVTSKSVNERDTSVTLMIAVSPAPTGSDTVVVSYETVDGTATGSTDGMNADYTTISSTNVTFDVNKSSEEVTIQITDDEEVEVDESFTLRATTTASGFNSPYDTGTGTITINDNDVLPTLTISDVTTPVAESAGSVNFVVEAPDAISLTVRYQASEVDGGNFLDTATDQDDPKETATPLMFAQADGSTGPFVANLPVSFHDDEVGENTGQIKVTLLNEVGGPTNYRVNTDGTQDATVTIWDDDAPVLSIGDVTDTTVESDTKILFPLTALVSPGKSIDVIYQVTESTTNSGDFIANSIENPVSPLEQAVDFSDGSKTKNLEIPIESDTTPERASTVTVTLSPDSVNLATADYNLANPNNPAMATVTDDDLPVVSIESKFTRVSDTGYVDYIVSAAALDSEGLDVVLNVETGDTIVDNTNSQLTARLTSANPMQSRQIQFNPSVANNSEVVISIATSISTYIIDSDNPSISFRVDDGTNLPEVSIVGDGAVSEGENAVFTIMTNETDTSRTEDLTINIAVSEGSTNFLTDDPSINSRLFQVVLVQLQLNLRYQRRIIAQMELPIMVRLPRP